MSALVLDEAIKEYLLFRGFTVTLKTFDAELKSDRDRAFQSDKVVEQLLMYAQSGDLPNLLEFWEYLDRRFFSRLEHAFAIACRKLELSLKKYYIVAAIQASRIEKVTEMFERLAPEIHGQAEWREWLLIPYLKAPESHPSFELYFSRTWMDTFIQSLHNMVNSVFAHMPLPTLMTINDDQEKAVALSLEVQRLTALLSDKVSAMPLPATEAETTSQVKGASKKAHHADDDISDKLVLTDQEIYYEHQAPVLACQSSVDGSFVASVDADGVLKVWSLSPKATKGTLELGDDFGALTWLADVDEQYIFVLRKQSQLLKIDVSTMAFETIVLLEDFEGNVGIASSENSNTVICALSSQTSTTLFRVNPITHSALGALFLTGQCLKLSFDPSGKLLAVGSNDGSIKIIQPANQGRVVNSWALKNKASVLQLQYSTFESTSLFSFSSDGMFGKWNSETSELISSLALGLHPDVALSMLPISTYFALDVHEEYVAILDLSVDAFDQGIVLIHKTSKDEASPSQVQVRISGHSGAITSVDWLPSLNICLTASLDKTIRITSFMN